MSAKRREIGSGSLLDRISNLPEPLLIHILSFLPTRDAIKTALLSKQWNNLWTQVSNLTFNELCFLNPARSVKFVNEALILHEAPKIHRLYLHMQCKDDVYKGIICTWIHYAVKKSVEELYLDLSPCHDPPDLPQLIFKNACFRQLELNCFSLIHLQSVSWPLLRSLSLKEAVLDDDKMNKILSGSPLLEELVILKCRGLKSLNLTGRGVKRLCFGYSENSWGRNSVKLCIPNVNSLSLCGGLNFGDYELEASTCLERVELGLVSCQQWVMRDEPQKKLQRIVNHLSHAKVLSVNHESLQMFSVCEMMKLLPSVSERKCMTLKTGLRKWELLGISFLLKSSPELEILTLKVVYSSDYVPREFQKKHPFKGGDYLESLKSSFRALLHKLKTIKLYSVISWNNNSKPNFIRKKLPEKFEEETEMVKFLLKNCYALEEMIVYINKQSFKDEKERAMISNMSEELLKCPRASSQARILFL